MALQTGDILNNSILSASEPVQITDVKKLGSSFSVKYIGTNTNVASNKILTTEVYQSLAPISQSGIFNFQGDPVKFGLFAEAERINSAYQFDPLFAVNCSVVDPLPHQVEAVYKYLLPLPQIRFLLADDTGAGKTIMTGLLLKEMLMRGLIERILIVTPGGLTKQWQEDELAIKFNLTFKLANRESFNADPTIFHNSNRLVTSIDFVSREDILNVVGNTHWDMIVFDESHKLSAYDYGDKQYLSLRYKAAQILAKQCEHILLLTATPHRGRKDTFKKLLQLLDEDIFATEDLASSRVKELSHNGANKFFIRRLKEDMKDWQGNPLFKKRYTSTVAYQLTPEEKQLYNAVTDYLTKRKEEASETKNIHVSLALAVMQRRLVSSIFAIRNTLQKRWLALQGIADEINKNPGLWKQKPKLEGFDIDDLDEFEDLNDDEREAFETILSDPKKFKLFTTATSISEINQEAADVKKLFEMANNLYNTNQEEAKFKQLKELLQSNGIVDGNEKLVIFTEHKDTLLYLEERLSTSGGYKVATIHGGKNVDERRLAQRQFFQPDTQILIGTDAAGEGINLQFCKFLINWDIPWNPNRLEQRMGRIHRYGQKEDVMVFNMVANNTREGNVLKRLLDKLDIIRESIGDDRVYDVIQDVFENVKLDQIIASVLDGRESDLDEFLSRDTEDLKQEFEEKIKAQEDNMSHSKVDFRDARILKEHSDEKRLQPIYIRLFFEKVFKTLGGQYTEIKKSIFRIDSLPSVLIDRLRMQYNVHPGNVSKIKICFDKQVFLENQNVGQIDSLHYINPGNPLFDSLVYVIRNNYREDMLKGTVLVSAVDKDPYFAFFVKSQIIDQRVSKTGENVVDERLLLVTQQGEDEFSFTSPAKYIDLFPPAEFALPLETPEIKSTEEVISWSYENITVPQLADTEIHIRKDTEERLEYLKSSFTTLIFDLQNEIAELQQKVFFGESKFQEKLAKKEERVIELNQKKRTRLENVGRMTEINPKEPEILGCAYVVPLTQVQYNNSFGMSRDDEAEAIAMKMAMDYEISKGWSPEDVSKNNEGYDIRSTDSDELKRYIEVKGRNADNAGVMLSENEMNRLAQLGDSAWLYIVLNCKTEPELYRIQNPANRLKFDHLSKGVQYFVPYKEWKNKLD
ncbi:helicase-related protein [Kaistella sp.]|uniref:helicase-related protein n=1 Tax=Kaistella sp. TaxID=2782235 RepID=UPI002F946D14